MGDVDPRLVSALRAQLVSWRGLLDAGARRVGWKLGMGESERIGSGPVIGHLTSATCLEPGSRYPSRGAVSLRADAELALELGTDGKIAGYGAALELVDLAAGQDAEQVVAGNVFHRAVIFGPIRPALSAGHGRLLINGDVRAQAPLKEDYEHLVGRVAELLAAVGERLAEGDRLITGSIVQVPVRAGDRVVADLGSLGAAEAYIT